jgi:hypothetical protein
MSYYTIKDGIAALLKALGYSESAAENFVEASASDFGNTFILKCISGQLNPEGETLSDRFYDSQKWEIKFAFAKSGQNDTINKDEMHEDKDAILKKLDTPANWEPFVRFLKYQSWTVEELKDYFILTVTLLITDTYIY